MSLLERLLDRLSLWQHNIYLISDIHFDESWFSCHRGFRHCADSEFKDCRKKKDRKYSRPCPFNDIGKMNKTLIDNWNKTVQKEDTVHFLGDWHNNADKQYDKEKDRQYWQKQLNGKILSIKGNHDHKTCDTIYPRKRILKTTKREYLLVHDPDDGEYWNGKPWKGWRIHGHHHNNYPNKHPFINGKKKTINVSVEVIGYKPVSLKVIEALDLTTIQWMQYADSTPTRFTNP